MMLFIQSLQRAIGFIAEAALEIFSPAHDDYPSVGEQPFGEDTSDRPVADRS